MNRLCPRCNGSGYDLMPHICPACNGSGYDPREQALEKRLDAILATIRAEVLRAAKKHPPMNSAHEGYAVILEEVDELWDHVKADTGYSPEAMTEASQIAAMGVRYMLDLED